MKLSYQVFWRANQSEIIDIRGIFFRFSLGIKLKMKLEQRYLTILGLDRHI